MQQRSKEAKEPGSPLHPINKVQPRLHIFIWAPISVLERHTHARRWIPSGKEETEYEATESTQDFKSPRFKSQPHLLPEHLLKEMNTNK